MNIRNVLLAVVAGAVAGAAPASATEYKLEPAGSRLTFTAVQQGAKFESRFGSFTAQVSFDPAQPQTGRITSRIDLGSVATGNAERDEALQGADWFNLPQWPAAVFTADRIVPDGAGFRADGTLTLRNVTGPVALRFRWTPAAVGQPARLAGSATLDRLAFGVGQGEWRETTMVGSRVDVQVDIRLRPAPDQLPVSDKSVSITGKPTHARNHY